MFAPVLQNRLGSLPSRQCHRLSENISKSSDSSPCVDFIELRRQTLPGKLLYTKVVWMFYVQLIIIVFGDTGASPSWRNESVYVHGKFHSTPRRLLQHTADSTNGCNYNSDVGLYQWGTSVLKESYFSRNLSGFHISCAGYSSSSPSAYIFLVSGSSWSRRVNVADVLHYHW